MTACRAALFLLVAAPLQATGPARPATDQDSTARALVSDTAAPPLESLAAVRADLDGDLLPDRLGERVRVRAVILSVPRFAGRRSQLLNAQDRTAGIVLFRPDTITLTGLAPGDRVEVIGRVGHDDGMEEIEVEQVVRLGGGLPPRPIDVSAADLHGETYSGRLVRLRGRLELGGGDRVRPTLVDGTGSVPIYIPGRFLEDPTFASRLASARRAVVTGVAAQSTQSPPYDDGYDVMPRAPGDLELIPPPPYWVLGLGTALVLLGALVLYHGFRHRRTTRKSLQLEALTDNLEKRDAILNAVAFAAQRFLGDDDPVAQLGVVLQRLVRATGTDAAAVVSGHAQDGAEPRRVGVVVACRMDPELREDIDRYAGRLHATPGVRPAWVETLREGGVLQNVPAQDRYVRRILAGHGMSNQLLVPVFVGDHWWGTMAFYSRADVRWSPAETDALKAAASILGAAFSRQAAQDALRTAEHQFRHAQKMEAIGRLAGGIAHDFNNLLTAIGGHAHLLADAADLGSTHRLEAGEIVRNVDRAARLTQQLLAFSRQQALPSQVVDAHWVVQELQPMLRRLIGEHIRLEYDGSPGAWVHIPPGQLEQVVVNLCVNARDAMMDGGTLRVRTGRTAGDNGRERVVVEVTDSGVGMDADTLGRAMEPFFTTKPPGAGTGLGLSTVYGIIAAGGGAIDIESERDEGTVVRLSLPVAQAPATPRPEIRGLPLPPATGTLLLAEDEASVRRLAQRVLERAGYDVIAAENGVDALARLDAAPRTIDLLVTDVRMPEMSGPQLLDELARRQPGVRVLYMSGYAAEELALDTVSAEAFLAKPFSPTELLEKVQRALLAAH
jgi:signal transduction histidine kinase/CheY-like chemotaxis protein